MSDIWIYRRRPSSLTRYRHGGAAAFDPAVRSPLARAIAVAAPSETSEDEKILQFPSASASALNQRPKRAGKPRRGRAKPKPPKKRD
jgi:hypothetical protein